MICDPTTAQEEATSNAVERYSKFRMTTDCTKNHTKQVSLHINNLNFEDTRKAVELIGDKCLTESSGNINEKTIRQYAECGVDYISSGALTHSVYNMDLSLKAF
jgi:nicotinate-nucleotide pyrophosphorylase